MRRRTSQPTTVKFLIHCACLLLFLSAGFTAWAEPRNSQISIIIDDVGYNLKNGLRAVNLPGNIGISVLPDTPYAKRLAKLAHRQDKEILLHLPMEALGPGVHEKNTLLKNMDDEQMRHVLRHHLNAVPHLTGVNNHMGGLLTQLSGPMRLVMQELRRHGDLFYVDSRTTAASVADHIAGEEGVPALSRDIFLDHARDFDALNQQFQSLLDTARATGRAIAIGHPHPETLSFLEYWLPKLPARGFDLVPVSRQLPKPTVKEPKTRLSLHTSSEKNL